MKQTELKRLVLKAVLKQQAFLVGTKTHQDNPQIARMRAQAEGRLEAYQAVRDALMDGDLSLLRIDADYWPGCPDIEKET